MTTPLGLSYAVRALTLMLKAHCNVGDMEQPPYGACCEPSHHEAREIIAAYKASVKVAA